MFLSFFDRGHFCAIEKMSKRGSHTVMRPSAPPLQMYFPGGRWYGLGTTGTDHNLNMNNLKPENIFPCILAVAVELKSKDLGIHFSDLRGADHQVEECQR